MYRMIGADGREYGPVTADQLRQWITEGRINAETQILAEGGTTWQPAGTSPEFSNCFARPSAPTPTPAAPFPSSAPVRQTHSLATAGLVLGILSITIGFCCCGLGLPFSVGGLICSIVGLSQIRREPERYTGEG